MISEVEEAIDKVLSLSSEETFEEFKHKLAFLSDKEKSNPTTGAAEEGTSYLQYIYRTYNPEKAIGSTTEKKSPVDDNFLIIEDWNKDFEASNSTVVEEAATRIENDNFEITLPHGTTTDYIPSLTPISKVDNFLEPEQACEYIPSIFASKHQEAQSPEEITVESHSSSSESILSAESELLSDTEHDDFERGSVRTSSSGIRHTFHLPIAAMGRHCVKGIRTDADTLIEHYLNSDKFAAVVYTSTGSSGVYADVDDVYMGHGEEGDKESTDDETAIDDIPDRAAAVLNNFLNGNNSLHGVCASDGPTRSLTDFVEIDCECL